MVEIATLGLALILLGFGVVAAGVLLSSRGGKSNARGAGVIMIGPIPLVFGSDWRWASVAIVLALLLVLLSLVAYLV